MRFFGRVEAGRPAVFPRLRLSRVAGIGGRCCPGLTAPGGRLRVSGGGVPGGGGGAEGGPD